MFSVAATGLAVTLVLPPGVDAELDSAPCSNPRELDVAIGDLAADDEIDLVFTVHAGSGNAGDLLPVGVTVLLDLTREPTRVGRSTPRWNRYGARRRK